MKIALIGFDREGRASYDYYAAQGHKITICDQNTDLIVPDGAKTQLGDDYLRALDNFDMLVRTPGLHPRKIIKTNPAAAAKITSGTNEFMRVCPSKNIIGVTGTKGKGTTSSLIAALLEAAGLRVHLGGNIGVPALELLKNDIRPNDWVVLELSSFQLIDLQKSPHIAVCLMVMPEHLDWHRDEQEYFAAKQQLFRRQNDNDIAIFYALNERSASIAGAGLGRKIPYYQEPGAEIIDSYISIAGQTICDVSELALVGKHNWQNICAAVTAAWFALGDTRGFAETLREFKGLPFRIENRRTLHDITYFNDSFATGPGSTMAAIEAISAPKVMIIGGYDRGLDLTAFAKHIAEHAESIRHILIIGASQNRFSEALRAETFSAFTLSSATTMPEIVAQATALAQPGDAVVLSPAFASFDMFKNFEDRGFQFNKAVQAL